MAVLPPVLGKSYYFSFMKDSSRKGSYPTPLNKNFPCNCQMDFLVLNSSIYQRSWHNAEEADTKKQKSILFLQKEDIDILAINPRLLTGLLLKRMLLLFYNSSPAFTEREKQKGGRFSKGRKNCLSGQSSLLLHWYFEVLLETRLMQSILQ